MNRIFKVVKHQRTGNSVVASELAKGIKSLSNIAVVAALGLLLSNPVSADTPLIPLVDSQYLDAIYKPSAVVRLENGYIVEIEENSNNYKKEKRIESGSIINLNLNDNNNSSFESTEDYKLKYYTIDELQKLNTPENKILAIDKYIGNKLETRDAQLSSIVDWTLPDIADLNSTNEINWQNEAGETDTLRVYDTSKIQKVTNTQLGAYVLQQQPYQSPFYHLTLVRVSDGALNLSANDVIDWNIKHIKDSSLFIADATGGKQADISASSKLHVTFGESPTLALSSGEYAQKIQPSFKLAEYVLADNTLNNFEFNNIAYKTGAQIDIGDLQGLEEYNQLLIAAVKANRLSASRYQELFSLAVVKVTENDPFYQVSLNIKSLEDKSIGLTDAMRAGIGRRAIFEVTGENAALTIEKGADIVAKTSADSGQYRAFNVYAHDGSSVTHHAETIVSDYRGQNAYISDAIYTNTGSLLLGKDNSRIYGDEVTGSAGKYINQGKIAVEAFDLNKNDPSDSRGIRNIGLTVSGNASAENGKDAVMTIGENGIGKGQGTATGVHVAKGSFINQGNMAIGSDTKPLLGGVGDSTYSVETVSNGISAILNGLDDNAKYQIINNGTISIGKQASRSVGLNVQSSEKAAKNTELTVKNSGDIIVNGSSSVGMRVSGANQAKGLFENTGNINVDGEGSIGLLALNKSQVIHSGNITAKNSNTILEGGKKALRTYGIRTDDASVSIKNGTIKIEGNNTVGVFARVGGVVTLNGDGKVDFDTAAENQIGYWIAGRSGSDAEGSSKIDFGKSTVELEIENKNSTLFRVDQKATFDGAGSLDQPYYKFSVKGEGSQGFYIADNGTQLTTGNMELNVDADNATGLYVTSGAGSDGRVTLDKNTQINISGDNATIATVDGAYYDLDGNRLTDKDPKAQLISHAKLSTSQTSGNISNGAIGYKLINGGILDHQGEIDFSHAASATGMYVNGGTLNNSTDAKIKVKGIGVDIYGKNSVVNNAGIIEANDGIAAIRLNRDASMTIKGEAAASQVIGQGSADGVRAHAGSQLTLQNAKISVTGSGNGIHLLDVDTETNTGQTFKLTGTGDITVSGENSAGLRLAGEDENQNPTMASKDLDTSNAKGVTIYVTSKNGNGIKTNTSGSVSSGMNVNIASEEGQSALVVEGASKTIVQSGKLTSNSNNSSVVDLTKLNNAFAFTNSGEITSSKDKKAVDAENNDKALTFNNSGTINGSALLGGGNNLIGLTGITSHLKAKDGNNSVTTSAQAKTDLIELGGGSNVLNLKGQSNTQEITAKNGNNSVTLTDSAVLDSLSLGKGRNTITMNGGTHLGDATTGNSLEGNTFILNNVQKAQSDTIFTTLAAGAGAKDALVLQGANSHYVLKNGSNVNGFENLLIKEGTFELSRTDITLSTQNKDGITIEKAGRLLINQDNDYALNYQVQGSGVMETSTNGQAFSFNDLSANFAKDNFTGILRLTNGTFDIADRNTLALAKALLDVHANSVATVRANVGQQSFDRLAINGGTLVFKDNVIGSKKLSGDINVNDLQLNNAKGTVQVMADGFDNLPTPDVDFKRPLLEQDEGDALVRLVDAATASQYIGGLTLELTDKNGVPIDTTSQDTYQDLRQNGGVVAKATYGYGLQTSAGTVTRASSSDGLYVAYRLTEIELQGTEGNALVLSSAQGKSGKESNLAAKVTGQGDLAIDTDSEYITLSNNLNDYTGTTWVRKGKLRLEADSAMGQTQLLDMAARTSVEFTDSQGNGVEQTVGKLNSVASSELALGNGKLTLEQGGISRGHISGSEVGDLIVQNSVLTVDGENQAMHARVSIESPAQITINSTAGLGNSNINVDGKLLINFAKGQLVNQLSQAGQVDILRQSDVSLTGNNDSFSGMFTTDSDSTLRAAVQNHLGTGSVANSGTFVVTHDNSAQPWTLDNSVTGTGTLVKQGAGLLALTTQSAQYTGVTDIQRGTLRAGTNAEALTLNSRLVKVAQSAVFTGQGEIKGGVDNAGTFIVGELDKETQLGQTEYLVKGDFANNGGQIRLASQSGTGSCLNVGGNFTANGGAITLNTILNRGHEETQTDRLVVGGNVKTGTNGPTILNIKTVGGKGADTRKQPDAIEVVHVGGKSDNGAFKLGAPVSIGIYEYLLHKGYGDDSWYLDSYDTAVYPPKDNTKPPVRNISPIIGSYLANQTAALGMFSMTLHDRLGEPSYADSLKGDENASSVWLRIVGDRQRHNAANNMLRLKGNTYTTQLGGDIISWNDRLDSTTRIGVMGAFGRSDYTSRSRTTGSEAKGKIDRAYSLGMYGTWYQNQKDENNAYVDVWTQYSWFDNKVSMGGSESSYNSHLFSASVEAGYKINLYQQSENQRWILTPQAQAIFNSYKSDDSFHDTGLNVKGERDNSVETRLGARLTYANQYEKDKSVQPFIEANWLHNNAKNQIDFNTLYTFKDDMPDNRYELKAGVEGQMSTNWSVWGHVAHQMGSNDYSGDRAVVGVKYQWK